MTGGRPDEVDLDESVWLERPVFFGPRPLAMLLDPPKRRKPAARPPVAPSPIPPIRSRGHRRAPRALGIVAVMLVPVVAVGTFLVARRTPGGLHRPVRSLGGAADATLAWSVVQGDVAYSAVVAVPRRQPAVAVALPSDLQLDMPGEPPVTAGQVASVGPRLIEAAQSLLARRVRHYVVSDAPSFASAIDRAGGVSVEVVSPFVADGRSYGGGMRRLDGAAVLAYLATAAPGDAFLRWQAVMQGVLASRIGLAGSPGVTDDGQAAGAVLRAARGATVYPLPTATGVDGVLRQDLKATRSLVAARLATAGGGLVRVVVLNGTGRPGVAEALAQRLAPEGYQVVAAQNDSKPDELTQVLASGGSFVTAADRVQALILSGRVYVDGQPSGLADVTIIAGKDLSIG